MPAKKKETKRRTRASALAPTTVTDGDCWAVPVTGIGFCPLVVARAPGPDADVDFAFAYLKGAPTDRPPKPDEIGPPESWVSAWLGLVSTQPMRKGRWEHCGRLPEFDRSAWPIPPVRASAVDEREPVEEWGKQPGGELWSIETTLDEPTMTVIANTPVTRAEALLFPVIDIVTGANRLEKGLATRLKGRTAGFWDMDPRLEPIRSGAIQRWREHAERDRAAWSPPAVPWRRAGRKTDRSLRAGLWMGMPLAGGGFGAAMLVAKPEPHQRFFSDAVVMPMRRRWERWPTLGELVGLTPEDGAFIAPTSMIVVRDGRWRVLGEHPDFDAEQWVWPLPWNAAHGAGSDGVISVAVGLAERAEIKVDPATLRLDPVAGRCCGGMSSWRAIELEAARVLAGTATSNSHCPNGTVTPERLAAWRKINAEIRRALAALGH